MAHVDEALRKCCSAFSCTKYLRYRRHSQGHDCFMHVWLDIAPIDNDTTT